MSAREFAEAFMQALADHLELYVRDPEAYRRMEATRIAERADYDAATDCGRLVDMGQWCCRANPCGQCSLPEVIR